MMPWSRARGSIWVFISHLISKWRNGISHTLTLFIFKTQCRQVFLFKACIACMQADLFSSLQMHKDLPPKDARPPWKPVVIKHGEYRVRLYARIGEGRPALPPHLPPSKKQAVSRSTPMSHKPAYSASMGCLPLVAPTGSEASGSLYDLGGASGRCVSMATGGSIPDVEPCSSYRQEVNGSAPTNFHFQ